MCKICSFIILGYLDILTLCTDFKYCLFVHNVKLITETLYSCLKHSINYELYLHKMYTFFFAQNEFNFAQIK